jgi:MFS family permease
LFAGILFIPEYQQIVRGDSAIKSGLLLLPLVAGMLVTLITVGRLITKYGHYRIFPIIGTIITGLGLYMFSHLTIHTSQIILSLWMIVLGVGIGSFMQVMTLAVQNSVPREELGISTATATFFRSMGSSLGGAIFGAVLINRLALHLKQLLPTSASGHVVINTSAIENGIQPTSFAKLPPSVSHDVLQAFALSFHDMFLLTIPFVIVALIVALMLKEIPLRTTTKGSEAI